MGEVKQEGEKKAPHRTPEGSAKSTSGVSLGSRGGGRKWGEGSEEAVPRAPGRGPRPSEHPRRGAGGVWSGDSRSTSSWTVPEPFRRSFGFWALGREPGSWGPGGSDSWPAEHSEEARPRGGTRARGGPGGWSRAASAGRGPPGKRSLKL